MGFPTTMWTTVREIRQDPTRAKDRVFRRYLGPLYEFARHQGLRHEEAEDAAQEVLIRVCTDGFLEKADRRKGRFRTLLLAVARHVIASHRRRELAAVRDRRRQVPIEDLDVPDEVPPDDAFDRAWMKSLVDLALGRLKDDPSLDLLLRHLDGATAAQLAEPLGKSEHAVENQLSRVRERLRGQIERLIRDYSVEEDVHEELAALLRHL